MLKYNGAKFYDWIPFLTLTTVVGCGPSLWSKLPLARQRGFGIRVFRLLTVGKVFIAWMPLQTTAGEFGSGEDTPETRSSMAFHLVPYVRTNVLYNLNYWSQLNKLIYVYFAFPSPVTTSTSSPIKNAIFPISTAFGTHTTR